MDLIDLYHAHEFTLLEESNDAVESQPEKPPEEPRRLRQPRFVPWEPYKAAPASDRKGEAPPSLPPLIPYNAPSSSSSSVSNSSVEQQDRVQLVDARKTRVHVPDTVESLRKQVAELELELDGERKLNRELKSIFLTSLTDDVQCQVEALAGDKIQLGKRLEDYCIQMTSLNDRLEDALIERDMWKTKFLAQSIRCDQLSVRLQNAVKLVAAHGCPREAQALLERSPCEQYIPQSKNSNLTYSCCRKCDGKDIHVL